MLTFNNSAAKMTTDVVPSPTSSSCNWANSTKTLEKKSFFFQYLLEMNYVLAS